MKNFLQIFRRNKGFRPPPSPPYEEEDESFRSYNSLPRIPGVEDYDRKISIYINPVKYMENRDWKKEQMLGYGGFGKCYQALDVVTGTLMAVKQIPIPSNADDTQKFTKNIKEEIELLGHLNHPHIVRLLGATEEGGTHINIFMEWMPGGSVRSLLDKFGPFHESVIIKYLRQVLNGLAYLHDNKILHHDLKGGNILVNGTGQHVRISDFGNAKCIKQQTSNITGGQVSGTLPYMAPEVIRGQKYGRSSDIWSVGCVIIEMATGTHPWDTKENKGLNYFALMYKIGQSPPSIPVGLDTSTRSLVQKCLVMNPSSRPRARELLQHPCFGMHDDYQIPLDTFKMRGSSSSSEYSSQRCGNNSSSDGTISEMNDEDFDSESGDDLFQTPNSEISNNTQIIFEEFYPEESEDI